MNEGISMEHQLRYETARANMYARSLKELVDSLASVVFDMRNAMEAFENRLDHDWSKLIEVGMVKKGELK